MKELTKIADQDVENLERDYLVAHPEINIALEIFGITEKEYKKFIAAYQNPVFFTSNSTIEGGFGGELG